MTNPPHPRRPGGFTLIEVVIAMFVIAIGIGALLSTLTASTDSISHLRDKSFAEWVALNRISETRLSTTRPGVGVTTGEIEYAGTNWRWRQEIIDPGVAGILRINVAVARAAAKRAAGSDPDAEFPALARAYGFVGTAVSAANAFDPNWSLPAAQRGAQP